MMSRRHSQMSSFSKQGLKISCSSSNYSASPPRYESIYQEGELNLSLISVDSNENDEVFHSKSYSGKNSRSQKRRRSRRSRESTTSFRKLSQHVIVDTSSLETFNANEERLKNDEMHGFEDIKLHIRNNSYPKSSKMFLEDQDGVTYAVSPSIQSGKVLQYKVVPPLSEEKAKTIFVKKKFDTKLNKLLYLGNPWKQLVILRIKQLSAWKYQLETTVEERCIMDTEQSSCGETNSTAEKRKKSLPNKWEIPVEIPKDHSSKYAKKYFKIPSTSVTTKCCRCTGLGHKFCEKCEGKGEVVCHDCYGTYYSKSHEACHECYGRGKITCYHCHGNKKTNCCKCNGMGNLEKYKQLVVEWNVQTDVHYCAKPILPQDFLRTCKGEVIHKARCCKDEICPLTPDDCLNKEVILASSRLIQRHQMNAKFGGACIREHKQVVSVIPVFEIKALWKKKPITYWIAGTNDMLYIEKYSGVQRSRRYTIT